MEIIDIVFVVMCVGILASLYMQHKIIEPLMKRIEVNESRLESINGTLENYYHVLVEKREKINILVDRVNMIQGGD